MSEAAALSDRRLTRLAEAARREGLAIFEWWARHSVDEVNGGFVGEVDAAEQAVADAPKAAILNARLLWYFSAYTAHTGDARALALANRAAQYIRAHFIDPEDGGLNWMLDATGRVIDARKHAYVQAFAIYAFAEYYAATGDGIEDALRLQALLETPYRDRALGGWLEAPAGQDQRLSEKDLEAPKTMNTHLHVLEAYTRLHGVAPSPATETALRDCLEVFEDRFMGGDGHLRLFYATDWTDLTEAVSFGHDIEASWLVWEAAEALGDVMRRDRLRPKVLSLAKAVLSEGLNPQGGVKYERRFDGHEDATGEWWCQAEAMVGFLNAFDLAPDGQWLDALERAWAYAEAQHGLGSGREWRWYPVCDNREAYLMGAWKCPYHNGRAMMEIENRLRRFAVEE